MYDHTVVDTLDFHHSMLLDEVRTRTLLQAILRAVKPGDVVLDIGSGTGILALFACLAGAKRVYAVEEGPIIEIAKQVSRNNGFEDRVVFLQGWSTSVELPERANVLVTETMGNAGFDEGILGWVADAKKRLLTSDARVIPREITMMATPVESVIDYEFVDDWLSDFYSFDYSSIRSLVASSLLQTDLSPKSFLGNPLPLLSVDIEKVDAFEDPGAGIPLTSSWDISRDGTIHGIGAWFSAELISGLSLTNAPPNRTPSWSQILLPLKQPRRVRSGDTCLLAVKMHANAAQWEWQVSIETDEKNTGPILNEPIEVEQESLSGPVLCQ